MDKNLWFLAIALVVVVLAIAGIRLFQINADLPSSTPHSIVTTFKDNPQTSRAFTWYTTSPNAETILQLVAAPGITDFNRNDVISISGTTSTIDTGKGVMQGVHKVHATNLAPGTRYSYRVGSRADNGWSPPAEFETEVARMSEITFINVTDSQGKKDLDFELWGNTLTKAFETFPDAAFVVHNGDLTEDPENESGWFSFFDRAQTLLRRYPLMPATGNHDEVAGNAERFLSHFNLPENGAKSSNLGTSYSFDYGPAHFVYLNTESKVKKQTEWLKADLAATKQTWIIVALHHGPYGGNQNDTVLDKWVPLFDEFGVDLVLQGHNHEYSRSYPLKGNQIVKDGDGTVYVVTNAAGSKWNKKKDDQFYHAVHFQNSKPMFAGIRISGDRLLYAAYDIDGEKLDTFTLKK
ncbi:metallophosphoesterase family protein [Brevibacillus choshinensis]|uniref:metallophosphoesterase family protein n=1 Tax=Brevibacillus choshinensis TaxID=54911 RepID=UPI002E1D61C2|nr:metallophosphoesterase family protein [Brevibacillus choshinensis]MED4753004.1 metallophosphoesterase family protein [Brevibacillus choshinensis]